MGYHKDVCVLSHLTYLSSSGDIINLRLCYEVDHVLRNVGGGERWRCKYEDNLPSSSDMMIQKPRHSG